ncbi:hypothetical protein Tco_0906771 [Tanacetum coccineum]|uniref:Tf2-1-like SH3-like domain-containing protein n=1 Tax=Tanacetum coccineum TaxID=301880 RepID=A0ABQ5CHE0_9ASTR
MFIEQSHDEVYGCLKGGSGNSGGKRLAISMVEEAWLSEKKEVKVTYVVHLLMFGFSEMMTLPIALQGTDIQNSQKTVHTEQTWTRETEEYKRAKDSKPKSKKVNFRKLNPRYVGPFKVLEKVESVAYKPELPEGMSRVHNTFHVSNLKKCHADEPLAVLLHGLHFDDKLQFVEELVEIIDREVKLLKRTAFH